jgi:hypothetical protein
MYQFKKARKMVSPSDICTILGKSIFDTPESLKKKMENGYNIKITNKITSGIRHEPKCIALYEKETKNKIIKPKFVKSPINLRFGGIADGLVGSDGGLEIKCQYGKDKPILHDSYIYQSIGYLYLYQRKWWDIMVLSIDEHENVNYMLQRIKWEDYENKWNDTWYPKILKFSNSVNWK